jgi:hypothetical protein
MWRSVRADCHAARSAERDERNWKAFAKLVEVVVVWGDAVVSIAIQVQADGVEGYAKVGAHARRRSEDRRWRVAARRIKPVVTDESRHVDLAVVHLPPHLAPTHTDSQLGKPHGCRGCIDKSRRIRNTSKLIVREDPVTRLEQSTLRHISVSHAAQVSTLRFKGQLIRLTEQGGNSVDLLGGFGPARSLRGWLASAGEL